MEKYKIIYPERRGLFQDQLSEMGATLKEYLSNESTSGRQIAYSKVFLSDIQNQYTALKTSSAFCDILSKPLAASLVRHLSMDARWRCS